MSKHTEHTAITGSAQQHNTYAWMFTFSDLTLLLLTMFVLRLSMSSIDLQLYQERIAQFAARPTPRQAEAVDQDEQNDTRATDSDRNAERLFQTMSAQLAVRFGAVRPPLPDERYQIVESGIELHRKGQGFMMVLGGSSFADDGITLSFLAQEAVLSMLRVINGREVRVEILGYTAGATADSAQYPSSWELSQARAMTIARQIIDAGVIAQYISVVGYAGDGKEIHTAPIYKGRYEKRVEITVETALPDVDALKS
ncbi:MAG TPA: flagellar motor protein MotB [Oligoflexia bacterium]|mgnify:CR=1 FL=1|nr:flagellar motor protein MotB [Oligoflexia bacterium]